MAPKPKTLAERFWPKVEKVDGDGCWAWTAARNRPGGYGVFCVSAKERAALAHRVSWTMAHGPIPDGLDVLHRCDNPRCVRPDHLFLGTHADNMADMAAKGRQVRGDGAMARKHPELLQRGDEHWSRRRPERVLRGEANGIAKLNEEKVREIRRRAAAGEVRRRIAEDMGVSPMVVSKVVRGLAWRHVQQVPEIP